MSKCAIVFIAFLATHLYGAEPYKAIRVHDGGAVTGSVILAGSAPAFTPFPITKDEKICRVLRVVDRLALGKNNGIMNCVVQLEGITRGKPFAPGKKLALDQEHCNYVPHLLVICPDDHLSIVNLDPILHNVHCCDGAGKTLFNIAQPIKGQRTPVTTMLPVNERLLFANCDAGHPWMSAYIVIADNPYYAITDSSGEFHLDNIPPGTYSMEVWHEGVAIVKTEMEGGKPKRYIFEDPYTLRKTVTVTEESTTTVDFSLSLRSDS
jgi:Carboxypeptidase regulatory-like domain